MNPSRFFTELSGSAAVPVGKQFTKWLNFEGERRSKQAALLLHNRGCRVREEVNISLTGGKNKSSKMFCVFNQTRDSFLSLRVTLTDTHIARLKGLAWKFRLKGDEGIWVVPSQGVHTIGVLFSIDLIYLDEQDRVIQLEESFGTFRIGPVRANCASVLELPTRTIYSSHTQVGDQLLIRRPEEMEEILKSRQYPAVKSAANQGGGTSGR